MTIPATAVHMDDKRTWQEAAAYAQATYDFGVKYAKRSWHIAIRERHHRDHWDFEVWTW